MTCEARRDDIFLLAAGSMEGPDCEELESHLRSGCAICAGELRLAQQTLADISLALDPLELGPRAKERLLARVAEEAAVPASIEDSPPHAPDLRLQDRNGTALFRMALAAGIAAVAAAGLTASLAIRSAAPLHEELRVLQSASEALTVERDDLLAAKNDLAAERDDLLASIEEQDDELYNLETTLALSSDALEMLRQPKVDRVVLSATDLQPHATAEVFWEWDNYTCYLHAKNLRALASDRAYAIWLFEADGSAIFVGTFTPDARGEVTFFQKLPYADLSPVRVAVTDEPFEIVEPESPTGGVHLEAKVALRERSRQTG